MEGLGRNIGRAETDVGETRGLNSGFGWREECFFFL